MLQRAPPSFLDKPKPVLTTQLTDTFDEDLSCPFLHSRIDRYVTRERYVSYQIITLVTNPDSECCILHANIITIHYSDYFSLFFSGGQGGGGLLDLHNISAFKIT